MPLAFEAVLAELGRIAVDQPLTGVLRHVAGLAVSSLAGADDASVLLLRGGKPVGVAFHGSLAADLDERQYPPGYGPGAAAAGAGVTICIGDTSDAGVFPLFAGLAARRGVRTVVSAGLPERGRQQGAVTVYCSARATAPALVDLGSRVEEFTAAASVVLHNAAAFAEAEARADNLEVALQSRAVIEQAKGVLMTRHGVDADTAFGLLATTSQQENRKLREVARAVVAQVVRP